MGSKSIPVRSKALIGVGILATIVAIALGAKVMLASSAQETYAETAGGGKGVDQRLADLEAKVGRIDEGMDRIAALLSSRSMHSEDPGIDPLVSEKAQSQEALKNDSARDAKLYGAKFRQEPIDPTWGPSAEAKLLEGMMSEGVISNVEQAPDAYKISCRSTMCEMTFDFSDAAHGDSWASVFATGAGAGLKRIWYTATPRPDGSVQLKMYGFN